MTSGAATWAETVRHEAVHRNDRSVVVIVEDDVDTQANLHDILELDDCCVESASTAAEVRGREDWSNVSTILLDRRLPDGDALELIPYLKSAAPLAAIVVITGYGDVDGAVTALRLGTADYILKPINPEALRASLRRIDEQRRSDQSLRVSQAQLHHERDFVESLIETVPSAVVLLDPHGRIERFNRWLEEACGYRLAEVRGDDWFARFPPIADRAHIRQVFANVVARGGIVENTSDIVAQDGRRIEMHWFYKALRGPNNALIGVLASGQDVTELKRAQEKALQSERLAAVGQAMAGLVHESRNALQRCRACTEMLAAEVEDRAEAMELVERIQRAQSDLHQLFEEVREYAAPIKLDRRRSDLREIWREVWGDLAQVHQEKELHFREACDGVGECCVDRFRMGQVFRNVFENAIHASPMGGCICVSCRQIQTDEGPAVSVTICDQGPGIAPEDRQRILDPFFTTKAKGTGLGMAICKRIVDAHGGTITVGGAPGSGAEISMTLPRGDS